MPGINIHDIINLVRLLSNAPGNLANTYALSPSRKPGFSGFLEGSAKQLVGTVAPLLPHDPSFNPPGSAAVMPGMPGEPPGLNARRQRMQKMADLVSQTQPGAEQPTPGPERFQSKVEKALEEMGYLKPQKYVGGAEPPTPPSQPVAQSPGEGEFSPAFLAELRARTSDRTYAITRALNEKYAEAKLAGDTEKMYALDKAMQHFEVHAKLGPYAARFGKELPYKGQAHPLPVLIEMGKNPELRTEVARAAPLMGTDAKANQIYQHWTAAHADALEQSITDWNAKSHQNTLMAQEVGAQAKVSSWSRAEAMAHLAKYIPQDIRSNIRAMHTTEVGSLPLPNDKLVRTYIGMLDQKVKNGAFLTGPEIEWLKTVSYIDRNAGFTQTKLGFGD